MSIDHSDPGHGDSPAAWTAVIVMLLGIAVGTVAFYFALVWLVWASAGVVVLGAILGFVLTKVGLGVTGQEAASRATD